MLPATLTFGGLGNPDFWPVRVRPFYFSATASSSCLRLLMLASISTSDQPDGSSAAYVPQSSQHHECRTQSQKPQNRHRKLLLCAKHSTDRGRGRRASRAANFKLRHYRNSAKVSSNHGGLRTPPTLRPLRGRARMETGTKVRCNPAPGRASKLERWSDGPRASLFQSDPMVPEGNSLCDVPSLTVSDAVCRSAEARQAEGSEWLDAAESGLPDADEDRPGR